jgi:hypothetical protein
MPPRLALNLQPFCLHLLSFGIAHMAHHGSFCVLSTGDGGPGPYTFEASVLPLSYIPALGFKTNKQKNLSLGLIWSSPDGRTVSSFHF